MLQFEVLILELVSVDGLSASAISSCEVTTLDHKLLDDTMEARPFVTKSFLASRKGTEILSGLFTATGSVQWLLETWVGLSAYLGNSLAIETKHDASQRFVTMLNVKIDLMRNFGPLSSLRSLTEEEESGGQNDH